jgi:hypothetical protein
VGGPQEEKIVQGVSSLPGHHKINDLRAFGQTQLWNIIATVEYPMAFFVSRVRPEAPATAPRPLAKKLQ